MNINELSIYDQVVRTTEGLECGRVGQVKTIDYARNRVRVCWNGIYSISEKSIVNWDYSRHTWVKATEINLASIPFEIIEVPIERGILKGGTKKKYITK